MAIYQHLNEKPSLMMIMTTVILFFLASIIGCNSIEPTVRHQSEEKIYKHTEAFVFTTNRRVLMESTAIKFLVFELGDASDCITISIIGNDFNERPDYSTVYKLDMTYISNNRNYKGHANFMYYGSDYAIYSFTINDKEYILRDKPNINITKSNEYAINEYNLLLQTTHVYATYILYNASDKQYLRQYRSRTDRIH